LLTDRELGAWRPKKKPFKVTDRDGMYVAVLPTGTLSFRYDYRLNGRRSDFRAGLKATSVIRAIRRAVRSNWPKALWRFAAQHIAALLNPIRKIEAGGGNAAAADALLIAVGGSPSQ
jgi:hypothetical protein